MQRNSGKISEISPWNSERQPSETGWQPLGDCSTAIGDSLGPLNAVHDHQTVDDGLATGDDGDHDLDHIDVR